MKKKSILIVLLPIFASQINEHQASEVCEITMNTSGMYVYSSLEYIFHSCITAPPRRISLRMTSANFFFQRHSTFSLFICEFVRLPHCISLEIRCRVVRLLLPPRREYCADNLKCFAFVVHTLLFSFV